MQNEFCWWLDPPFYSTFLGFFGVPLILTICYCGYQNQCCTSNISFSHFLTIFFFWGFPPKIPQWTFLFWRVLGLTFNFFSRLLERLFRTHFWLPHSVFFLQIGRFLPVKLKDPQPHSFMVHLPAFLEVPGFPSLGASS